MKKWLPVCLVGWIFSLAFCGETVLAGDSLDARSVSDVLSSTRTGRGPWSVIVVCDRLPRKVSRSSCARRLMLHETTGLRLRP